MKTSLEPQICVQLRKEKQDNETVLIAIFPYEIATIEGDVDCLTAGESHSRCSPRYVHETKPCNVTEAKELLSTLHSAGYTNLKVIQRAQHSKYMAALEQARKY
jgi:hypothetical protein